MKKLEQTFFITSSTQSFLIFSHQSPILSMENLVKIAKSCHYLGCSTLANTSNKKTLQICSRCRSAAYCNKECQKKDWERHQKICKLVKFRKFFFYKNGSLKQFKVSILPFKKELSLYAIPYKEYETAQIKFSDQVLRKIKKKPKAKTITSSFTLQTPILSISPTGFLIKATNAEYWWNGSDPISFIGINHKTYKKSTSGINIGKLNEYLLNNQLIPLIKQIWETTHLLELQQWFSQAFQSQKNHSAFLFLEYARTLLIFGKKSNKIDYSHILPWHFLSIICAEADRTCFPEDDFLPAIAETFGSLIKYPQDALKILKQEQIFSDTIELAKKYCHFQYFISPLYLAEHSAHTFLNAQSPYSLPQEQWQEKRSNRVKELIQTPQALRSFLLSPFVTIQCAMNQLENAPEVQKHIVTYRSIERLKKQHP